MRHNTSQCVIICHIMSQCATECYNMSISQGALQCVTIKNSDNCDKWHKEWYIYHNPSQCVTIRNKAWQCASEYVTMHRNMSRYVTTHHNVSQFVTMRHNASRCVTMRHKRALNIMFNLMDQKYDFISFLRQKLCNVWLWPKRLKSSYG
jgi:hypothetical protein